MASSYLKSPIRRRLIALLLSAGALAMHATSRAADADPRLGASSGVVRTIKFRQFFNEKEPVTIDGRPVSYRLGHFTGGDPSIRVVLSFGVDGFMISNAWYHSSPGNEIMPIIGSLYEVASVETPEQRVTALTVRKVTDKSLVQECGVAEAHLAILVDSEMQFYQPNERDHDDRIQVKGIDTDPKDKTKHVARLFTGHYLYSRYQIGDFYSYKEPKLLVGDSFTMGSYKFTVAKIVPPDEKRHLIGWIELAHEKVEGPKSK